MVLGQRGFPRCVNKYFRWTSSLCIGGMRKFILYTLNLDKFVVHVTDGLWHLFNDGRRNYVNSFDSKLKDHFEGELTRESF